MSGTSVIKTAPSQDLLGDLRKFVAGATRGVKSNPLDLARTALSLLKTLPAARDAVLEYFCTLFDVAVSKYVLQIEADMRKGSTTTSAGYEEATIAEIHNVLCEFVSSNPKAWAPIISTWSLELLGELSSRYAGRAHVPLSAGLNETLQLWMSCRATRTLIDITTQCLSCLMHSDTEACINALLDTSVAHSPHFDWVVAHVGSCFPHTVITRVLSCGLKDFSQHGSADQSAKAPKLNSVVGILGHLAGSHFGDIKTALLELFKSSLEIDHEEGENSEYAATVPYLLQLASLSPTLLRALTTDVLHTLTPDMLPKLTILAPDWCTYFGGSQALEDLIVHLARSCEQGGTQILKLLLDAATPDDTLMVPIDASVRATSREILELLLQEIDNLLRSSMKNNSIPLLESIKQEINSIQPLLLSKHMLHVQTAVRLLGLLGHQSMSVLVSSAAFLLQRATTDDHLAALIKLVTVNVSNTLSLSQLEQETGGHHKLTCLAQALEQAIRNNTCCMNVDDLDNQPPPEQLWLNIARLLRWEQSGKVQVLRGNLISSAVRSNLKEASHFLYMLTDASLAHAVAAALDLAIVPPNNTNSVVFVSSVQLMLLLAKSIVAYFFLCVSEKDPIQRLRGVRLCCRLLSHLSTHSPPARALALRELLEGSLFHEHAHLFGARPSNQLATPDKELRLLIENHKQGTSVMLAQRHSSVFHAGVIGYGPRRPIPAKPPQSDTVMHRTQLLIDVIKACCAANSQGAESGSQEQLLSQPVSLDAITSVSLLLVELISPDVMYNGLPWPEEDFCKVTVERDLYIRRLFDDLPLAWHLMTLVATYRPALCYCSVLLRALTATLLAQWGSAAQQTQHNDKLLATTAQVLELMALGQLLPPPLSSLRDIIPHLKAQEVVQLLRDCVWNYMRDHVPSPALFTRDENGLMWRDATQAYPGPQYTDTLRIIMQNNIKYLGSLYCQLFPTKQH